MTKTALWGTAGVDGAEWRVVITWNEGDEHIDNNGDPILPRTEEEIDAMKTFVAEAAAYGREHGREAALAAFNDPEGDFVRGELYIFSYADDGTCLALPYQPGFIGSKRLGFEDSYGVNAIEWEIEVARAGGGFVYVTYTSPATGIESLKLCYVVPAGPDWLIGSGIYAGA